MVQLSVKSGVLHLELLGSSKLLALAGSLDIPLACIRKAAAGPPGRPRFRSGDRRVGGTGLPGFLAAGRYRMGKPRRGAFLDLRGSTKDVLVLELANYRYDLVMVEVADIGKAQLTIDASVGKGGPSL